MSDKVKKYRILSDLTYSKNKVQKLRLISGSLHWKTIRVFDNLNSAIVYRKNLIDKYGKYFK